jgi:hypothetical protein
MAAIAIGTWSSFAGAQPAAFSFGDLELQRLTVGVMMQGGFIAKRGMAAVAPWLLCAMTAATVEVLGPGLKVHDNWGFAGAARNAAHTINLGCSGQSRYGSFWLGCEPVSVVSLSSLGVIAEASFDVCAKLQTIAMRIAAALLGWLYGCCWNK